MDYSLFLLENLDPTFLCFFKNLNPHPHMNKVSVCEGGVTHYENYEKSHYENL